MRGSIIKRGKKGNSYTLVFDLGTDPATGKRKQQWVSVKGTKKEAEQKLAEMLNQLNTGAFIKPDKMLLADYLERWLKDYAIPNLSPRTAEGYASIIHQHLIPKLGNIPLTQLRPDHIQKYYTETQAKGRCDGQGALNPLTVRHHHMALHRALQVAVKWGLIPRNPADAIDPPHFQRHEMHVMNEDNIQVFLEAAKNTPYYTLFYTTIFTGMRRSELLALRWSDIDLIMGQISVNRSIHRLLDRSLVFRAPKTAKGRRTIALSPSAILVLKEHLEQQIVTRKMAGETVTDSDLVFCHGDGSPMLPDSISQAWRKLAKRTGLAGVRLHDARHSHASLMLKQGIHPKIVQERLGHASIATTLDIYSHVAPGLQAAAALRFDEMLAVKHGTEAGKETVK